MELRPPSGPLPGLFGSVRERHPDADIVLLRPEEPRAADRPGGGAAAESAQALLAADREAVARTLETVAAVATGAQPDEGRPRAAFGPREDTVLLRGRHLGTVEQSPIGALTTYLTGEGWELARPTSDHEVLLGRREGLELTASYAAATGVLSLTVVSSARRVGLARARELASS